MSSSPAATPTVPGSGSPAGAATAQPRPEPGDLDDVTLAVRAQEGDLVALERLLRRHEQPMYRLALRILDDRRDAEDAVQEALLAAWRNLAQYRGDAKFSTWLYRIVTNRCFNMTRTRQRHHTIPFDTSERSVPTGPKDSPEAAGEVTAERSALQRAVAALPTDQRACWVLRENDGLGYEEIAEIVGVTPTAARGQIYRARQALARTMQEWR